MNALYSWLSGWVQAQPEETETPWNTTEEDKDGMKEVTENVADG